MEASALHVPVGLARGRTALGSSLLRLRSDEQLVAQFRQGNDEAFAVIHDRYRQRLFAYTRQMFPWSRQDAEDAVQDVFVRAYSSLRSNDRELLALRAWLYRVAHNRCIDQLRRPPMPVPELLERVRPSVDPIAEAEQRDSLRLLIADVRRLPEQQRSALLMRELGGMSYEDLAGALTVTVPAIKSLLVRARINLVLSAQSRDTPCFEIREELALAHDQGARASTIARRHLRDCGSCEDFCKELRGTSRQLAALVPAVGPAGILANILGIGGTGSGGAAATGAFGGGIAATGGATLISAGHIAAVLAAASLTTGGALEIQHAISAPTSVVKQAAPWISPSFTGDQPGNISEAQKGAPAPAVVSSASSASRPIDLRSTVVTVSPPPPTVRPTPPSATPISQATQTLVPPRPSDPAGSSHTALAVAPTGASTRLVATNGTGAGSTAPSTSTTATGTDSGVAPPSASTRAGSSAPSQSSTPSAVEPGASSIPPNAGSNEVQIAPVSPSSGAPVAPPNGTTP